MRKAAKARQCFELVNERTEDESAGKSVGLSGGAKTAETQSST